MPGTSRNCSPRLPCKDLAGPAPAAGCAAFAQVRSSTQAAARSRIRVIAPQVDSNDVRVIYTGSGIGYVGDPRKDDEGNPLSQISPVVTVQVINQRVRAMSLMGLGLSMPSFQYSQLLEDGEGAIAY